MKRITLEWLCLHHACEEQCCIFDAQFPDGIKLTRELLLDRSITSRLNCAWLAHHLPEITGENFNRYLQLSYAGRCDYMGLCSTEKDYWPACAEAIAEILFPTHENQPTTGK